MFLVQPHLSVSATTVIANAATNVTWEAPETAGGGKAGAAPAGVVTGPKCPTYESSPVEAWVTASTLSDSPHGFQTVRFQINYPSGLRLITR